MKNQNSLTKLSYLIGTWKGNGIAKLPAAKPVEYVEKLVFTSNYDFPVLHYEQKTWVKSESGSYDKSIFWETGFILEKETENVYELCSVQKSGRVEVLTGEINIKQNGFDLSFKSKIIANDDNVIKSGRNFHVSNKTLTYELWMSTKENENYELHLNAALEKTKPL